jgi:hypothetical protein
MLHLFLCVLPATFRRNHHYIRKIGSISWLVAAQYGVARHRSVRTDRELSKEIALSAVLVPVLNREFPDQGLRGQVLH